MSNMDAIFEMPETPGPYWYFCEAMEDFVPCEVADRDGVMIAMFTDGHTRSRIGSKAYFVGPIPKPRIDGEGKIGV